MDATSPSTSLAHATSNNPETTCSDSPEGNELDELFEVIEEFLSPPRPSPKHTRILTTILITHPDRDRLSAERRAHGGHVRRPQRDRPARDLRRARPGDPVCGPIRADAANDLAPVSTGIHAGEVDLIGDHISGPSLEIAESIADRADTDEVLVSRTVKDLVVGSGITFQERGYTSLAGTSETWPLFAVTKV